MITVKVGEMLGSIEPLNELVEAKINIVAAFKIARIIADVNKEVEAFVKAKDAAVLEFDLEDEKQLNEAEKIVQELTDSEIELNHKKLLPDSLGTAAILKPRVLMALAWLFAETE